MIKLESIFEEVDNLDREYILNIFKKLVRINTTNPPGNNYRTYVDVISHFFKDLNYELEEVTVPKDLIKQIPYTLEGPRINLVARKDFGQEKEISFFGHMDVVPASNEGDEKWKFPPFEPTLKGGKIFGRGVADNKGAMVCLILAMQIIKKLNLTPKFNINILNCTDEEIGFYPGARYLAENGYVKGTIFCMDFMVDPVVLLGSAGDLDVEIEVIGRSSHSGLSFLGVNALEESIPILTELIELKKKVENRVSKDIPGFPDPITAEERNLSPLFNIDMIKSGEKSNIIPNICKITINRRIIPDEQYENVKQEIVDAIERGKNKSKALDVRVDFKYSYPSLKVNINEPDVKKIIKVIKFVQKVPDQKIRKMGMSITFDIGYVADVLNTQNIIVRGVAYGGSNTHGVNEVVRIKDVKTFIKEILAFLCGDF
jgi:succinyl-diaminopimelate desuccinylase